MTAKFNEMGIIDNNLIIKEDTAINIDMEALYIKHRRTAEYKLCYKKSDMLQMQPAKMTELKFE